MKLAEHMLHAQMQHAIYCINITVARIPLLVLLTQPVKSCLPLCVCVCVLTRVAQILTTIRTLVNLHAQTY